MNFRRVTIPWRSKLKRRFCFFCLVRAERPADLVLAVMPSRSEKSLKVSQWTLNFTQKVRERNLQVITKKLKDNGFKPVKSGLVIHFTGRAFVELSSEPLKYDNAAHKIGQAVDLGKNNWTLVARTDAVALICGNFRLQHTASEYSSGFAAKNCSRDRRWRRRRRRKPRAYLG